MGTHISPDLAHVAGGRTHARAAALEEERDHVAPHEDAHDACRWEKETVLGIQPGCEAGEDDVACGNEAARRKERELRSVVAPRKTD